MPIKNEEQERWYVLRVDADEYSRIVPDRRVFFNEPVFTELNRRKVHDVLYLIIMRGESHRFGLIVGRIENEARIPFSAPYSYPVSVIKESKQETIDAALTALENYLVGLGISRIRFVFPPLFYDEHLLSGWISALYRSGFRAISIDLSYALDLRRLNIGTDAYEMLIPKKGRVGLRKARKLGLEIEHCQDEAALREAYSIIAEGHDAKGFPMRLTCDELLETLKLVKHDAFIVRKDGVGIVAEFLYHVNDRIVQGIYTGTNPKYMDCNGMSLLTCHTIMYYGNKGFEILDKATATVSSVPNYGLCNFKENMGATRSLKYTFEKSLIQ